MTPRLAKATYAQSLLTFARTTLITLFLVGSLQTADAQLRDADPDWVELAHVNPATFDLARQLPFASLSNISDLSWAIDPKTFVLGQDGVSRLVVIATSTSGTLNIRYDGIHCAKRKVKTYARATATGHWTVNSAASWQDINGGTSSRYALALAKQALCDGLVPRSDIREIEALLKLKSLNPRQ